MPQYADAAHTLIRDGNRYIPVDVKNADYAALVASEVMIAAYTAPALTASDVDRERDQRIKLIQFQGHTYDGRDIDLARIDRAKSNALAAIINGAQPGDLRWADASIDFAWITHDNQIVPMDAETCLAFGLAAAAWEGQHIIAARALKNMSPIPADYATNASYWPGA